MQNGNIIYTRPCLPRASLSFQFHFKGETRRQRANDGAWLLPIYRLYNHGLPLAGEDSTFSTARSERGSQRRVTDEIELESVHLVMAANIKQDDFLFGNHQGQGNSVAVCEADGITSGKLAAQGVQL